MQKVRSSPSHDDGNSKPIRNPWRFQSHHKDAAHVALALLAASTLLGNVDVRLCLIFLRLDLGTHWIQSRVWESEVMRQVFL
jgi:hypothetical protein